jgi:sialic acid synthase SpsE
MLKIASQRTTDIDLLREAAKKKLPTIISTGMCNIEDVDRSVEIFKSVDKYLMQCTSSYPCIDSDINLNVIKTYQQRYADQIKGYGLSGHHTSISPDISAYIMGATIIERHFTLDRAMKGTDHKGSLEINGIIKIIRYIRQIQDAMGSFEKKVLKSELPSLRKLRGEGNG